MDRNIKRAYEKGQEAYIEKFYEVGDKHQEMCAAMIFIVVG